MKLVGPQELEALIAAADVHVIDVREPNEWASGHIPGARHVPLGTLRADPKTALPRDNVVFVCAKGGRSATAAEIAEKHGLTEVYSLDGGTEAWRAARLPIRHPARAPSPTSATASASAQVAPSSDARPQPELDAVGGRTSASTARASG
jgi:rhodanese-related sulfurtransferase